MRGTSKKDSEQGLDQEGLVKAPEERSLVAEKAPPAGQETKAGDRLAPAQSAVVDLQRSYGNQFVVRMLGSQGGAGVQRKCACGGTCPTCRESAPHTTSSGDGQRNRPGGGQPLDPQTRAAMETRLGQDFGDVRVHHDAAASGAAEGLHAQAFTVGPDVFFASGKYRPDPSDPLLTHELVHVAQQRDPTSATMPTHGDRGLEAQAEHAEHAVSGRSSALAISAGAPGVQRKPDDTAAGTTTAPPQPAGKPSFFQRIGHGIASAAETAWHGIKAAGSAIGEAAQAVGHGIAVAADAVWTGLQWVGKQLWNKVTSVFERIAYWMGRLPARLGRLVMGLWEGVKSMHPWSLKWWESLAKADTWTGFLQWLGANMISLAELLGLGEVYETVMDFVKFNTRKLTGGELSKASSVFGASINFEMVRIDEHAIIGPAFTHREYTSFHTINGWGGIPDDTLIHELTHVWQYERTGAIYMAQAIHAQIKLGGTKAYDYNGVSGLRAAKTAGHGILSFNREQQAQIVQDFYRIKTNRPPEFGAGTVTDLPVYAHFVKDVSTLSEGQLLA